MTQSATCRLARAQYPTGYVRSCNLLPTKPWPATARGQDNLAGRIVGNLTVIGLAAGLSSGPRGARWVVLCVCGAYEHRTTHNLRKGDPTRAMCFQCDSMNEMVKGRKP